jgi:mono/diheme cytochrome c family protein
MTQHHTQRRERAAQSLAEARQRNRLYLVLLLLVSLATAGLLVKATYEESVTAEWRRYQGRYGDILREKATDDWGKTLADSFKIEMAQIVVPPLEVTDRCITCHTGIADPRMAGQANPHAFHPGQYHAWHEPDKFGCTVCHQGQGRAVEHDAAHGRVAHWDHPMLSRELAYTRCSLCHYENDLFGADEDIHTAQDRFAPIRQQELSDVIPGLEMSHSLAVVRGKQLTIQYGCLGCHTYRGRGGTLGPDISYVGDKTVHDFDFSHVHVKGKKTVSLWLLEHFKHPAEVSPGTLMPDNRFTDRQAQDLTAYMLSLHRKTMPSDYTPVPKRTDPTPASGHQLFAMFCASCHGTDGGGSTVREADMARAEDAPPELMVPSLNNPDTLAVISDDYLRYIIEQGREGTNMIDWAAGGQGNLHGDEIDRLVAYIRSWQTPAPDLAAISATLGDARLGSTLYQAKCASCHGRQGQGGIGTRLDSPGMLAVASDAFLTRTLVHGRANTAMPGWPQLGPQRLSDLLAFLRSWHTPRSTADRSLALMENADRTDVSARIGGILYRANCVTCHGADGAGDLAPSIATEEFLSLVDDRYLYHTLLRGRSGTGMPAWRHLTDQDMASIVLFMNTWRQGGPKDLPSAIAAGDWDAGRILFDQSCASCHGPGGEGAIGPQLSNPEFLAQTTDAMLQQWIAHGKSGTPMLGFLRGTQGMVDLSVHQINNIVAYVRSLQRQDHRPVARYASGRPGLGRLWYATYCVGCHGDNGEGASGPAVTNPDFLAASSSGFLMATLALGRDGTEMRPVKDGPQSILALSSDQINDLVAFLRRCETEPPIDGVAHHHVIPWDLALGRSLYQSHCGGCHGLNGKAELTEPGRLSAWAPELNNQNFLRAATDGFLQATIARGRDGTSMRAFGQGAQGLVDLSSNEIDDIVAYIRQWSTQAGLPMTRPAQRDKTNQPTKTGTSPIPSELGD